MSSELREIEKPVMVSHLYKAFEFLKQNVPGEKLDELYAFIDNVKELIKSGEKLNVGDMTAELINPRKFGLPQELVEEFLRYLLGNEPDAESVISGTIEYAKKKIWRKKKHV